VHADADVQPAFAGVEPQKNPAYRPPTGKVWNGTANAMSNKAGVVTAYAGAWVPAPVAADGDSHGNAGVMPHGASCDNAGVPPKRKPHGRVPQGKVWNGTANPLKDDEGVVTAYTGAWVCAESDGDTDSDHGVPPRRKPHCRVPEGMVWNGTANPLKDDEGVVSGYAGAWVRAESDGDTDADHDSSDNGSECLHDVSHNAGKKRTRTQRGAPYRPFNAEWKNILPWLMLLSTLTGEEICPHRGKDCAGCAGCSAMFCTVCMERNGGPAPGSNIAHNPFVTGGCKIFRKQHIHTHTDLYHLTDLDKTQRSVTDCVSELNKSWRDRIISLLRNVYWLVKENISMRKIESLCVVMRMQGVALGAQYCNSKAARDFLTSLAHVVRMRIVAAARSTPCLGLMIDESTDIVHTSQMVLYL
jgi:hypothetical protein